MNRTAAEEPDRPLDRRRAAADRRGHERYPFVAAVRHEIAGGAQVGLAANLGLSGMKVERASGAEEPDLQMHAPLQLSFELPDGGRLVELSADVVFDRPKVGDRRYRMTGLRFRALAPDVEERLRAFLQPR